MADIKSITLPDNNTYYFRDSNCVKATSSTLGIVRPDNSSIVVDSDGIISATGGGGGSVTVDDALSTSSENPVQNKVITSAVNGMQSDIEAMQNDPVDVTGSVSAASGSDATICYTAQYGEGVYLVSVYVSFPASSSGRRHIHIASTTSGAAIDNWSQLTLAPSNAQPTIMQLTTIQQRTGAGRWYLRAYQNSGSAQTVSGGIRVLKLH